MQWGHSQLLFLPRVTPRAPGPEYTSRIREADHEWEVEDLSPEEAAVASGSGAALEAARRRRGQLWAPRCFRPSPSSLGFQVRRLACSGPRLSVSGAGEVGQIRDILNLFFAAVRRDPGKSILIAGCYRSRL